MPTNIRSVDVNVFIETVENVDVNAFGETLMEFQVSYLAFEYKMRMERERLFLDGEMSYYITPKIFL